MRDGKRSGLRVVVDADIKGFFDHLDHQLLLHMVRQRVTDRRVVELIGGWLRCGVLTGRGLIHPEAGTPQGGVISPLLANIYLNHLDQGGRQTDASLGEMTRYADDLVVICRILIGPKRALALLRRVLNELGLESRRRQDPDRGLADRRRGFRLPRLSLPDAAQAGAIRVCCSPPVGRRGRRWRRPGTGSGTHPARAGSAGRPSWSSRTSTSSCAGGARTSGTGTRHRSSKPLDAFVFERIARFIARKHGRGTGGGGYGGPARVAHAARAHPARGNRRLSASAQAAR